MNNNKDVLSLIFRVKDNLEYEVNNDGIVTVLEKQDHKLQNLLRKINFNIPKYKKIEMDKLSSDVFLQINGERSVKDIGEYLEDKYGEQVNPLYDRLLVFLNHIDVDCQYIEKLNY